MKLPYLTLASALTLLSAAAGCGNPDRAQDTEPEISVTAPAATQTPEASTATPVPGLTDTGYTAPDGRPLYAECIQEGLPLPPEWPEPIATAVAIPTADPAEDPNEAKAPLSPDELPSFDIRTMPAADTTGWILHESKCFGYSILLPPHWTAGRSAAAPSSEQPAAGSYRFYVGGYQAGESATLFAPGEPIAGKVDLSIGYSPLDANLRGRRLVLEQNVVLIATDNTFEQRARPGREIYLRIRGGALPGILLQRTVATSPNWRFSISAYLTEPYDKKTAAEIGAILSSVEFY